MFLTMDQIDHTINWLLANGSPTIQYLTHKHLLKTSSGSPEMLALWQHMETCPAALEILSKQEPDGSWYSGGSWALKPSYLPAGGWDPYNPKYVTSVWILPLLGEMGFTVLDPRIRKACEYVLTHGYFLNPIFEQLQTLDLRTADLSPCRFAQYLFALASVGLANERQVIIGYDYLLQMQRSDGGWALPQHILERNWTRSCPFSTYHAVMALYHSGNPAYRGALVKGLEFLAWHLSTKEDVDFGKFFYHGHSLLRELLVFSEFGIGLDSIAIHTIIEWLSSMYSPQEGCFRYPGKPISQYSHHLDGMDHRVAKYRLYHLIENDWLTYHLTRVGLNLNNFKGL